MLTKFTALTIVFLAFFASISAQTFDGYALYNGTNNNTAYLIDKDGNISHTWSCDRPCNYTVLLKENGNIVRGAVNTNNQLNGAAIGGLVQELDADANVVWEFTYSDVDHCSHHDISLMPNGNVLLIAWEVKSTTELEQAGFDNPSASKWPTHFVEVQQNGTGGEIVWEWHIWDHFIQDHDSSKDNFGVVADHPELMDINAISGGGGGGPGGNSGDWFHANGIDYNETLDQIVFTSRHASELFIIDHSTTTAEAASHSGGNSEMGGDFIYRWGNPSNYGSSAAQTVPAAVHDPRWIEDDGRLNGGFIQFFNNEGDGGSTVDAIQAPQNGFNYDFVGNSYGPATYNWRHECLANADGQSSHDIMSNSNVFVNVSMNYMYEVDTLGNTVWQYNDDPAKAFRFECDHPGVSALLGFDPCEIGLSVENEITNDNIAIFPNPSSGKFNINGIDNPSFEITLYSIYGAKIDNFYQSTLDLSKQEDGVYFIVIDQGDSNLVTKKITLIK